MISPVFLSLPATSLRGLWLCRGNRNILQGTVGPCHQLGFRIALRRSLRLILRRVWRRAFVLEHLAEITAIDPAAAERPADEMLGLVLGRIADAFSDVPTTRNHFCGGSLWTNSGHATSMTARLSSETPDEASFIREPSTVTPAWT